MNNLTLLQPWLSRIEVSSVSASIAIGPEYIGKVAVAKGKEIATNIIQYAEKFEALLVNTKQVKAITLPCVGVGTTALFFIEWQLLLSVEVVNFTLEETFNFASTATNFGVQHFAKMGLTGRTLLSSPKQIQKNSYSKKDQWWSFAWSI